MTALRDWEVVGPPESDAILVRACLAGDRGAFAGIYDRYADRLHDFCAGMLHDCDGAADCVQDCFCVAATRLSQLRDPEKLRPWLYSIARNEALRRMRDRRRETPSDELPETVSDDPGPDTLAARTELAELLADAAGGLSDRDRSVLELAFRHGLNGTDLSEALGVTPANANTIVRRLRETIERSLGALLVARRVRSSGGCTELAGMLDGWDGHFNVLMRKRISRHIESCTNCDEQRRELVSPTALLGAAPVFIPAPAWLRDKTLSEVELTCHGSALDGESLASSAHADNVGAPQGDGRGPRSRRSTFVAALLILLLFASLGLTFVWLKRDPVSIVPIDLSETLPEPSAQSVVPSNAPPTQTGVQVQTTYPVATLQPPPSLPEVQILVPTPPIDESPPSPESEPTPEPIAPVPPPSAESPAEPELNPPPQNRPTRRAGAPPNPASEQPNRDTINNPADPGSEGSDAEDAPSGSGGTRSDPGDDRSGPGGTRSGSGGDRSGSGDAGGRDAGSSGSGSQSGRGR